MFDLKEKDALITYTTLSNNDWALDALMTNTTLSNNNWALEPIYEGLERKEELSLADRYHHHYIYPIMK